MRTFCAGLTLLGYIRTSAIRIYYPVTFHLGVSCYLTCALARISQLLLALSKQLHTFLLLGWSILCRLVSYRGHSMAVNENGIWNFALFNCCGGQFCRQNPTCSKVSILLLIFGQLALECSMRGYCSSCARVQQYPIHDFQLSFIVLQSYWSCSPTVYWNKSVRRYWWDISRRAKTIGLSIVGLVSGVSG